MDKFSFLILNFFINSFLSFFTACLFIEGLIFLFRIRPGRLSAFLRMIPLLKLPLDIFRYDFSRWTYAEGINPLLCEDGTRALTVLLGWFDPAYFSLPIRSAIECTVHDNKTFTIADIIGHKMDPLAIKIFSFALLGCSAIFILRKLAIYNRFLADLKPLAIDSQRFEGKVDCSALASRIANNKLQILISPKLTASPFTSGLISSKIYLPSQLLQTLSQKECEAVLVHELEHIRYKDNLMRLILNFIGTLFWWIPTPWLRTRIEENQETSCDLACRNYSVNPIDLASAISKSAKCLMAPLFASCLTRSSAFRRIDELLTPQTQRFKKLYFVGASLTAAIAVLLIFLGRFWIF